MATTTETINEAPSPEEQRSASATDSSGRLLAADGTPLKLSLARALRRQKMRALMLVAPLFLFILVTFLAPIGDMLFRSVENQIVPDTIPETSRALETWQSAGADGDAPPERVFRAMYFDLFLAAEMKSHTRLGSRLNYAMSGMSSLFRASGRDMDDIGETWQDPFEDAAPAAEDAPFWQALMSAGEARAGDPGLLEAQRARLRGVTDDAFVGTTDFVPDREIAELLPRTAAEYTVFALATELIEEDSIAEEEPWEAVFAALAVDLTTGDTAERVAAYTGPEAATLRALAGAVPDLPPVAFKPAFIEAEEDWADPEIWTTIKQLSAPYTSSYFLSAVDMERLPSGEIVEKPEFEQIYVFLFERTLFLSVTITLCTLLLGYPIAYLMANLPLRTANLILILVLLPFWTSLLVRTSSWIVLLQQEGVINDMLVWLGVIGDDGRLQMIFNQTGTIVAMTHILLPFMILPLYSVMKTIPPSYVRAAKSLGATDWTAFWRVYFPNSVPGIGAGAILVFILSIGYYITPELVGGTSGTFISNRIAYHISSSLNWGLAAALASILLFVVLILYWTYDRLVGVDNLKLG